MNILKTFETFWSLPKKMFGNKAVRVAHIEQEDMPVLQSAVFADVTDSSITMNVYNNKKVYSLLSSVLYKKKMLNENKVSEIYNERTFA